MRLSDLHPDDVQVVSPAASSPSAVSSKGLRLSDLHPDEVEHVQSSPQQSSEPGELEALGRGAAQGLTFGFGDELQGGAQALYDKAQGGDGGLFDLYHKHLADARAANDKASKAHPWIYGAGNIAGSVPTAMATGGLGAAAGLGRLGTVVRLAGQGAIDAGLMGAGGSTADLTSGKGADALQFGKDVAGSGLAGAGGGALIGAAAPALRNAAVGVTKNHLRFTPGAIREFGHEGATKAAAEALDSGAVRPFAKADTTAVHLADAVDAAGAVQGDIVNASTAKIDPLAIADKFDREVIQPLRRAPVENKQLIAQMEKKKLAFLNEYAPGYTPGGRAPGTPTTITRKSQFMPQEPTTDFGAGMQQVGENVTPNIETQTVEHTVPGSYGQPQTQTEMRAFHTGDTKTPVMGYSTPEASLPFKTDPNTGLPVKQIAETRLEGVPEVQPMSPAQVEAEKIAANKKINYKRDNDASIDAQKGYARVLKESSEEAITDPNFKRSKEAYQNLTRAAAAADRTGSLTNGGGLLPHVTDVGINTEALHMAASGNPLGLALAVGRAVTKGRVSSTAAVGLDQLSKIIQTNPYSMGKFAPILKNAAMRGPEALSATHFIMSQQNPEYREQASQAVDDHNNTPQQ